MTPRPDTVLRTGLINGPLLLVLLVSKVSINQVIFCLVQDTKNLGDALGKTGIGSEIGEIAQQLNVTPATTSRHGAAYNIPMNPANDGQVGAAVPPANWKPYKRKQTYLCNDPSTVRAKLYSSRCWHW